MVSDEVENFLNSWNIKANYTAVHEKTYLLMVPPNVTCTNAIKVLRSHLKTVLEEDWRRMYVLMFVMIKNYSEDYIFFFI